MPFNFKAFANRRTLALTVIGAVAGVAPVAAYVAVRTTESPPAARVRIAQPVAVALAGPASDSPSRSRELPLPDSRALGLRRAQQASAPFHSARSSDLDCLTQAVYFEARGETAEGQAAVAQVVLNRVRHPAFPKTVCGVVYQGARTHGCQFSFACDGAVGRGRETSAWNRAHRVAAQALAGAVMTEVGAATHFHAMRVAPGWGSGGLQRVAQVGLHVFYRLGRSPRSYEAPRRPAAHPPVEDVVLTGLAAVPPDDAMASAEAKTAAVVSPSIEAPPPAPAASAAPANPAIGVS